MLRLRCQRTATASSSPHNLTEHRFEGDRGLMIILWMVLAVLRARAGDGSAPITQDDLGNTYNRVGDPDSNYKP